MKENTFRQHLKEELKNPAFRKEFRKEDLVIRVAVEIATAREKHHITQKELAKKMHTSQQSISRIEQGKQNITIDMIERIADVLGQRPTFKFV